LEKVAVWARGLVVVAVVVAVVTDRIVIRSAERQLNYIMDAKNRQTREL